MSQKLHNLIQQLIDKDTLKGTSLIATIYGDSVLHRGGNIGLASLIQLMQLFGFNERAVRTAVFRLVKKGWLNSEKIGRISYYRITETSRGRYLNAEQRIYSVQLREWDRLWTLVSFDAVEMKKKTLLKKELEWLGYVSISTNFMAYPNGQEEQRLRDVCLRLQLTDGLMVFKSEVLPLVSTLNDQHVLEKYWDIAKIRQGYLSFLDNFREMAAVLTQEMPTPEQAFQIRTLLIHYYRRMILKDPALPLELLPADWPLIHARNLAANLYKDTYALADEYFLAIARTAEGSLPVCAPAFNKRFSDLPFGVYE